MDFLRLYYHPESRRIERMENKSWKMWMKIVSVYDGDTCTIICIFRGKFVRWRCRMFGYDSPELRSKDETEKQKARLAKEYFESLLTFRMRRPFRGTCRGIDKYGRILLDLKINGKFLHEIMIEANHANPYMGKKKMSTT